MRALIKYFLLVFIYSINLSFGFAQWNDSLIFNQNFNFCYGTFKDADFINENTGMYNFSCYHSPSSGTEIAVKATTDFGVNWNYVFHETNIGEELYFIFTVRRQNTFYYIYRNPGIV